jgi:hypothetical protein
MSLLYSNNLHPQTNILNTGFKDIQTVTNTFSIISKRSIIYQKSVINTMFNRAKYITNLLKINILCNKKKETNNIKSILNDELNNQYFNRQADSDTITIDEMNSFMTNYYNELMNNTISSTIYFDKNIINNSFNQYINYLNPTINNLSTDNNKYNIQDYELNIISTDNIINNTTKNETENQTFNNNVKSKNIIPTKYSTKSDDNKKIPELQKSNKKNKNNNNIYQPSKHITKSNNIYYLQIKPTIVKK